MVELQKRKSRRGQKKRAGKDGKEGKYKEIHAVIYELKTAAERVSVQIRRWENQQRRGPQKKAKRGNRQGGNKQIDNLPAERWQ